MAKTVYTKYTALTGGASTALDSIDGDDLAEGDHAILYISGTVYFYLLDEDSAATESSPTVISPDDNAGDKRWILQNVDHGPAKENLLDNSGFGVWSNSDLASGTTGRQTDYEVGSAIRDDDPDDGDNSGDYSVTDCTIVRTNSAGNGAGGDDYYYTIARDNPGASPQEVFVALSGLTVGKLYKFSCFVKDGTDAISADCEIQIRNNADSATVAKTALAASAAWADFSVIWEATETNNGIKFYLDIDAADETMLVDEIQVYEVTPGCVGANETGPDGWTTDTTLDVHREHSGDNTKDGAFYSLKCTPGLANDYIFWPSKGRTNENFYKIFAGRTVTFGVWVKTSTASNARLRIYDGVNSIYSSYHTGGGDWEWLEKTVNIDSSATIFSAYVYFTESSGVAYLSQPMLVFGTRIGEGNYSPKSNETIWFEQYVTSNALNGTSSLSDASWPDINTEADSNGVIPKGAKAFFVKVGCNDSASAGTACHLALRGAAFDGGAGPGQFTNSPYGLANDAINAITGWQGCNNDGDFEYYINATGSGTFDVPYFRYMGVQLR